MPLLAGTWFMMTSSTTWEPVVVATQSSMVDMVRAALPVVSMSTATVATSPTASEREDTNAAPMRAPVSMIPITISAVPLPIRLLTPPNDQS